MRSVCSEFIVFSHISSVINPRVFYKDDLQNMNNSLGTMELLNIACIDSKVAFHRLQLKLTRIQSIGMVKQIFCFGEKHLHFVSSANSEILF